MHKINTHFAPIEQVCNAQKEIRDILGVNIDLVSNNFNHQFLISKVYPWYKINDLTLDQVLNDLAKILEFCEIHHLSKVILSKKEIFKILNISEEDELINIVEPDFNSNVQEIAPLKLLFTPDNELKPKTISFSTFAATKKVHFKNTENEELIILNLKALSNLLKALKSIQIDETKVKNIESKSNDPIIKRAIAEYFKTKNLSYLKSIVKERLAYYLNNYNMPKHYHDQKIYETIEIKGEYVKIISTESTTKKQTTTFTTLLDFLEIPNYETLLNSIDLSFDDQEIYAIAALYLYLHNKNIISPSKECEPTLYDQIYAEYQDKATARYIPGLNTKLNTITQNIKDLILNFGILFAFWNIACITGLGIDYVNEYFFHNPDTEVQEMIREAIKTPYRYSFEYEKNLANKGLNVISDLISKAITTIKESDLFDFLTNYNGIGDITTTEEEPTIYAQIDEYDFNVTTSGYYANGYASSATYQNGVVIYDTTYPAIPYKNFKDEKTILTVRYEIKKKDFQNAITKDLKLNLPLCYYPLDRNYVITKLEIIDAVTYERGVTIDALRAQYFGNSITAAEAETLRTLKHPQIWISYGSSIDLNNPYTTIQKEKPYSKSPEAVKKAIIRGLGLNENASLDEAFKAIKNKAYSATPLEDGDVDEVIKYMNEEEFYETIASLDSTVCNVAAFLAANLDNNLIYTIGYVNHNDDGYIKNDEAHAWAIYPDASILEVTPSLEANYNFAETPSETIKHKEKTKEKIEEQTTEKRISIEEFVNFINWGIDHHIPETTLIALILFFLNYKFGPKVALTFKISEIKKLLNNPNIAQAYAEINSTLYGGLNLPREKTPAEITTTIAKDFSSFTKEELQTLKQELASLQKDKEITQLAQKLVRKIPFIIEYQDEINDHLTR